MFWGKTTWAFLASFRLSDSPNVENFYLLLKIWGHWPNGEGSTCRKWLEMVTKFVTEVTYWVCLSAWCYTGDLHTLHLVIYNCMECALGLWNIRGYSLSCHLKGKIACGGGWWQEREKDLGKCLVHKYSCHLYLCSFCVSLPGSYGRQMDAKCLLVPMAGSQKGHTNHSGMVWQADTDKRLRPSGMCACRQVCGRVSVLNMSWTWIWFPDPQISYTPLVCPSDCIWRSRKWGEFKVLFSAIRDGTMFIYSGFGTSTPSAILMVQTQKVADD